MGEAGNALWETLMEFRTLVLAVGAVALAACTSKPPAAPLVERSGIDLCEAYYIFTKQTPDPAQAATVRQDIERRNLVPAAEWPAIESGQVSVGMSQCGALAAWGTPEANNQTVSGNQQTIQFVYGPRSFSTDGSTVISMTP
jgi:hypothetical protein